MSDENLTLRPVGKGFVTTSPGRNMPAMRMLVEAYTDSQRRTYIKLDGKITPLLPSHNFMPGN